MPTTFCKASFQDSGLTQILLMSNRVLTVPHIKMELVLLHKSTHSQDCGMALQTPSKDIPAWSRIAIVLTIEVPFAWRRDTGLLSEMQEMHDYLDRRPKLQEEQTDQTHGDCKFICEREHCCSADEGHPILAIPSARNI